MEHFGIGLNHDPRPRPHPRTDRPDGAGREAKENIMDRTRKRKINAARSLLEEIKLTPRIPGQVKAESQKFIRIDCVLPPEVKKALDIVCSPRERTRSSHIERALRLYFKLLGIDVPETVVTVRLPDTL